MVKGLVDQILTYGANPLFLPACHALQIHASSLMLLGERSTSVLFDSEQQSQVPPNTLLHQSALLPSTWSLDSQPKKSM